MAKLRGIVDSKRRYQTFVRNRRLAAPPAPRGALDQGWHMPSPGPDGTLTCACLGSAMRYSPAAYAAHIAGRPMTDSREGVYVTGPLDAWVIERERQQRDSVSEPIEQRTDSDGWLFERFENHLQQKMVRYLTGPKAGQVEHAPAMALPPAESQRRAYIAHGTDPGMT